MVATCGIYDSVLQLAASAALLLVESSSVGPEMFQQQQEVLVPLAVENLGCSGSESRLLDCPVEMLTLTEVQSSTSSVNRRACSPFSNTYAFVACGALSSQGMIPCTAPTSGAPGSHPGPAQLTHRCCCILQLCAATAKTVSCCVSWTNCKCR